MIEPDLTMKCISSGKPSLHLASKNGNVDMVKLLIEAGLNVNDQDNSGKTPIILAIENKPCGYSEVIELLCKANANIYLSDKDNKNAARLVFGDFDCFNDHIIEYFLNLIHEDCMYNSERTAKILIILQCHLWQAVLLGNAKVIEHMILNGCPVNSCHPSAKFTALSKAVQLMNLEIVKVLIEYNANVDLCDVSGFLPIARYGTCIPGKVQHPEIIKILLNKTVLLKDLQENSVCQLRRAFEGGNKEVVQMLLNHHDNILNFKDQEGQTPLHYLSGNFHADITEVLQGRKIDVNVSDVAGRTPLFTATRYSYSHLNTYQFLLKNGANVNAQTMFEDLDVPLFSLCQHSILTKEAYFKIIEMFLECGLDVQFVGMNQKTVFDIILEIKSFYMAEPLLAHLAILDELGIPIVECIRNKIESNDVFKKCFDVCKAELINMKNNIINDKLTLYMILVHKISDEMILKSCRYSSNSISKFEKLTQEFHPNNHYYAIVIKRISSTVSKLQLLQKAALIMCEILTLKNNPYHVVVNEILDYLNEQDLQNLVQVRL